MFAYDLPCHGVLSAKLVRCPHCLTPRVPWGPVGAPAGTPRRKPWIHPVIVGILLGAVDALALKPLPRGAPWGSEYQSHQILWHSLHHLALKPHPFAAVSPFTERLSTSFTGWGTIGKCIGCSATSSPCTHLSVCPPGKVELSSSQGGRQPLIIVTAQQDYDRTENIRTRQLWARIDTVLESPPQRDHN